jgi:hypothetical protein
MRDADRMNGPPSRLFMPTGQDGALIPINAPWKVRQAMSNDPYVDTASQAATATRPNADSQRNARRRDAGQAATPRAIPSTMPR